MGTEGADCEEEGGAGLASENRERRRELALFERKSGHKPSRSPKIQAASQLGKFITMICQGQL